MFVEWMVPVQVKGERLVVGRSHAFGPLGTAHSCCGITGHSKILEHDARRKFKESPERCKKCAKILQLVRFGGASDPDPIGDNNLT